MNQDLSKQVESILAIEPESRNSDITLTIELWKTFYPQDIVEINESPAIRLSDLFNLPREDNIKRIRAKIQNEDRRYLPTNIDVFIERAKQSDEWKRFLGYKESWIELNWREALVDFISVKQQEIQF